MLALGIELHDGRAAEGRYPQHAIGSKAQAARPGQWRVPFLDGPGLWIVAADLVAIELAVPDRAVAGMGVDAIGEVEDLVPLTAPFVVGEHKMNIRGQLKSG